MIVEIDVFVLEGLCQLLRGTSTPNFQALSPEGMCKATWKRESKLQWREAGPPNHLDEVDSDQWIINKGLSLSGK